jgi:hypothetical protein
VLLFKSAVLWPRIADHIPNTPGFPFHKYPAMKRAMTLLTVLTRRGGI